MFAGIVVFSILGFKATMVYEKCLAARNETIQRLAASGKHLISGDLALNNSTKEISLPVCDLEKELDNVCILISR